MTKFHSAVVTIIALFGIAVFGGVSAAVAGPLHGAARDGDTDNVRLLIAEGADVGENDAFGALLRR